MVGAPDGHASSLRPWVRRVDDLLRVRVAHDLEVLLARRPHPEAVLEHAPLAAHRDHVAHRVGAPGPHDLVSVGEGLELGGAGVLRDGLPGDRSRSVLLVERHRDVDQLAFRPLLITGIYQPVVALLPLAGPLRPDVHARPRHGGVEGEVLVLLQHEVELLHPRLAEAREVVPDVVGVLLHGVPAGPGVPGAGDAHPPLRYRGLRGRAPVLVGAFVTQTAELIGVEFVADHVGLESAPWWLVRP
mmetsp:Transcript_53256/g.155119  ORF Transcript_53256/g.155119 Transcript_53256/m.155119 type:complete len:244 (-) Transcript_53256:2456-3187(-)